MADPVDRIDLSARRWTIRVCRECGETPTHGEGCPFPGDYVMATEAELLEVVPAGEVVTLREDRDRLLDANDEKWHKVERLLEELSTARREVASTAASAAARMLAEFHEHPNALGEGTNTQALRRILHDEEHAELMAELHMAAARELADVIYVTYGTAWAFGIDLDAALAEVHRAAMDKIRAGVRRADGKILKPPGFRPPDMTEAVRGAA